MARAQRKSRKKQNKQDGSCMRDPTANAYRDIEGHNRGPETGDQEMPKAVREMLRRIEEGKRGAGGMKRTFPKKKDAVTSSLAAAGIHKGAHGRESVKGAMARMHETINREIADMQIKAKAGVAGKDAKDIAQEYKAMDEKARSKREMKLLKRKKEEEAIFGRAKDKTVKRLQAIETERLRDGSKAGRRKAARLNREKERKKEERTAIEKESMLDAKEVIDFGERYDAPPTFKGQLKTRIAPLAAKAGGKSTLLVHALLGERMAKGEAVVDIPSSEATSKKKEKVEMTALMMAERQRVIDSYRQEKRKKNGTGIRALKDTIDL